MKESKDPFDRMILDDLEREADEIRRSPRIRFQKLKKDK